MGAGPAARDADKAFLDVGGQTLVELTTSALRAAATVGEVVAIGPHALLGHPVSLELDAVYERRSAERAGNIELALEVARGWRHALLAACDLPMLTPEGIDDFVRQAPDAAHVAYPVVRWEVAHQRYPGYEWRPVRLGDGGFIGGAMLVVDVAQVRQRAGLVQQAFGRRRSQLALARVLGPVTLMKFLLGRATVGGLLERIAAATGLHVAAVESQHPEIALDIDEERHLTMVERALAQAGASE